MTRSPEQIADQIRGASHDPHVSCEVLASLFASEVELRHSPPGPNDGPISGSLLADVARREVDALLRAVPDARHDEPDITVQGDVIVVRRRTRGSLPDGSDVELSTNTVMSIAEGSIVSLESDMSPDEVRAWQRVLAAGGFEAARQGSQS